MTSSIKWSELIAQNPQAVKGFAVGTLTKEQFRQAFSSNGGPNPVRQPIRTLGTSQVRTLARKALQRRGVSL